MKDETTVVPLRGIRGMVADKMLASAQGSAQVTHYADCDMTALGAAKESLAESGTHVSIEDLLIFCVVQALGRHPDLNGTLVDREITLQKRIHISIAIALPGNLLVAPTIFDAHAMSVTELRERRQDLAARAKANKVTVKEMTGGTFTISNLGISRVHHFSPIINAPQIGICGFGRAEERACRGPKDELEWRRFMGLSLTFDHRAVDGAPAAAFLSDLCQTIEDFRH